MADEGCFICGDKSHYARECPKDPPEGFYTAVRVEEGTPERELHHLVHGQGSERKSGTKTGVPKAKGEVRRWFPSNLQHL